MVGNPLLFTDFEERGDFVLTRRKECMRGGEKENGGKAPLLRDYKPCCATLSNQEPGSGHSRGVLNAKGTLQGQIRSKKGSRKLLGAMGGAAQNELTRQLLVRTRPKLTKEYTWGKRIRQKGTGLWRFLGFLGCDAPQRVWKPLRRKDSWHGKGGRN